MRQREFTGPGEQGWGPGELCSTGRGSMPRSIMATEALPLGSSFTVLRGHARASGLTVGVRRVGLAHDAAFGGAPGNSRAAANAAARVHGTRRAGVGPRRALLDGAGQHAPFDHGD